MLLCSNLQQSSEKQSTDRTAATQLYPNLEEAPRFVTHARRMLLLDHLHVMAPTGVAAFNVGGFLHILSYICQDLGEFKALQGEQLQQLQQSFSGVDYLIIDEMSMLGRNR